MIDTVYSPLRHLVRDVLSYKIGVCAREIELVQVSTGKSALEKKRNIAINDRFRLKIPISDQYMNWDIVFNCSLPNCPPDFDLNDTDFFYSISLDSVEELIPSLNDWNHRKDKALINVITELRSAYLKYQVDKLNRIDNRCAYQYASLISDSRVPPDQVEVFIDGDMVHFLIRLHVDLSLPSAGSEDYIVVLAVRYGAHGTAQSSSLIISDNITQLIGTCLELPRNIKSDESLSEYVEEVSRSAENQVLTVFMNRMKKRKQFIFEMLKRLGRYVLSYDALEYTKVAFLLEKGGFVCMMEVNLPVNFPSKSPHYKLISIYSTNNDRPLIQNISLPFNHSWEIHTMVDQALNVIRGKKIQYFQDTTVPLFRLPC